MFDFGWQEFMMIAFVLVLVVGPKDLPKVLRSFSKITRKARTVAREFTQSLEEVAGDADITGVKQMVSDIKSGNLEDMAKIVDNKITPDVKTAGEAANLHSVKENIEEAARIMSQNESEVISSSAKTGKVDSPPSPPQQDKA